MPPTPASPRPPLRTVRHTLDIATSHDRDRGVLGLGIVLRAPGKRAGPMLEQHAEAWARFPRGPQELFAILRGLEIAQERGLRVLRVRWANNAARRRMKKDHRAGVTGGPGLRGAVLRLAGTFEVVQFAYAKRQKIVEASALARRAVASDVLRGEHTIFESVPAWENREVSRDEDDEWEDGEVVNWETGEVEGASIGWDEDDEIPF